MTHTLPQQHTIRHAEAVPFAGFAAPTSNTTYTPNQFFDICLRHSSRGVVRLVGYLIRQTLGWCDADGNPLRERVQISYRELEEKAGISRNMIRKCLDEALASQFIECVQAGKASTAHSRAVSAHYQLRWDSRAEYCKDPTQFGGFFEGEGNRTDIPNQFFDQVIRHEPLSVIKVVGSIIRFSIGFQARRGMRRQQVALSFRDIERYARMGDTHVLAEAIRHAEHSHYIVKLQQGVFDPNAGRDSRPAIFALRWADTSPFYATGAKTPATESDENRCENPRDTGAKTPAENRCENPSDIETKSLTKEIRKQQQGPEEPNPTEELLRKEGFTKKAARLLAGKFPHDQIAEQIAWLPRRAPTQNRLGMLRRAIEENWPGEVRHAELSVGREFAEHFYAGLAGNPGVPVAEPSIRDLEVANRFVERLITFKPARIEPAQWARTFARHVIDRKREGDVPSLVLALRQHGDAWLLHFGREQARQREQAIEARKATHRLEYERAWLRFLMEAQSSCRTNRAAEYAAFESSRGASRWQLEGAVSERVRLVEFQRHFGLPDFWQWDSEFNEHPLCR